MATVGDYIRAFERGNGITLAAAFNSSAGPEHDMSREATMQSLRSEHKTAIAHATKAMTASAGVDHNGAADRHYRAALVHENAADKTADPYEKRQHMKASKAHMEAGHAHRMASVEQSAQPEPDEDDMTQNVDNERLDIPTMNMRVSVGYPMLVSNGRVVLPYASASADSEMLPLPAMNLDPRNDIGPGGQTRSTTPNDRSDQLGPVPPKRTAAELFGSDEDEDESLKERRKRLGLSTGGNDSDLLETPTSMAQILNPDKRSTWAG